MGVTINSVSSTKRQAGAEYLHSFTPVRLHIQDKKAPLPEPGTHTASGARQTFRKTDSSGGFPYV